MNCDPDEFSGKPPSLCWCTFPDTSLFSLTRGAFCKRVTSLCRMAASRRPPLPWVSVSESGLAERLGNWSWTLPLTTCRSHQFWWAEILLKIAFIGVELSALLHSSGHVTSGKGVWGVMLLVCGLYNVFKLLVHHFSPGFSHRDSAL